MRATGTFTQEIALKSALIVLILAASLLHAADTDRWEKDIAAFEAADKSASPPEGAVLFVGASHIRMWKTLAQDFPDCKIINRGFGGCKLSDVVHFANRIVIPYKPRLVVIRAGGNDVNAGATPEQVLANFKLLVEKVQAKLPQTRIAFLSFSPSPARWAQFDKQKKADSLIKDHIAMSKTLSYINVWDVMLDAAGQPKLELYAADKQHNSDAGYKAWIPLIQPFLK